MAVSTNYLAKIRRSVRRNENTETDAELIDIIEECRRDLETVGVTSEKTTDETDSLILGAVRCFARWKFGLSNEDADKNREDYFMLRDELRRKRDYMSFAITFNVKSAGVNLADAYVTFNGETKQTDSSGNAVFYYVKEGVNQEYSVAMKGYVSQIVDLDVTATATVNVVLIAG